MSGAPRTATGQLYRYTEAGNRSDDRCAGRSGPNSGRTDEIVANGTDLNPFRSSGKYANHSFLSDGAGDRRPLQARRHADRLPTRRLHARAAGDLAGPRSDAKAREVAFRVAQPGCGARREHTGEHLRSIGGKGKRRGRGVLFEAGGVACAGDRHDKRLLRQQPGKR